MPALQFDEFDPDRLKQAEQAVRGHEGGGPGVVSPQGAVGPGQVMPGTFRQYAQPGERIGDPKANIEVSNRILRRSYEKYGGDVGRMATDYFSGAGNVAPLGSPFPWKQNRRDVNESVSQYVANVKGRMPKSAGPMTFDEFKPEGQAKGAMTFDEFLPPHRTADALPWRVPKGQEGPRVKGPRMDLSYGPQLPKQPDLTTTPQERLRIDLGLKTPGQIAAEPFAADPEIAARIKSQPGMLDSAVKWIRTNYPDLQIADMMGDLTNWAAGKGEAALESAFTKAGVPNPGRAARDLTQYVVEFMPMQSGLGRMGFKPRPDLTGIGPKPIGEPGTGVPHIPGEPPPAAEAKPPPPKYQPVPEEAPPGGMAPPAAEPPPEAPGKPPEAAPPPPEPQPAPVHGGPSAPAPEVPPDLPPAEKPKVAPKERLTSLEKVTGYLNDLSDQFGLPRLPVEAKVGARVEEGGQFRFRSKAGTEAALKRFDKQGVPVPRDYVTPTRFLFNLQRKMPFLAWAAAHEFGHYLAYTKLLEADRATQDAIAAAYRR